MAECSFTNFAPIEWYVILALVACFAIGVVQINRFHKALFIRPRQTVPRAALLGLTGVILCALPVFDLVLFGFGKPSALVTIASTRSQWCDLQRVAAEKAETIGQLERQIADLKGLLTAPAPAAIEPPPAPAPTPLTIAAPEPAFAAEPPPAPPPAVVPEPAGDMKVVIYYRRGQRDLAVDLKGRVGANFEAVTTPSDLTIKGRKPRGTVRIVYTAASAYALANVRQVLDDALREDPSRAIVAEKVNELRNGDLQIQLF